MALDNQSRTEAAPHLAGFYLLAFMASWLAWLPLAAGRLGMGPPMPAWLHLAGSLGPALAAIACSLLPGAAVTFRGLIAQRSPRGLGLAIALPVAIGFAGLVAQWQVSGDPIAWDILLTSKEYAALSGIPLLLAWLVFYGFGEEIGWRGYALPVVLRWLSPLSAAVVMALPWALWHLPLLVSSETYRALGPAGLAGWAVSLLTGSVLQTWLYLRSGRSLIAVACFHALLDIFMVSPATGPIGINVMGALVTVAGLFAAYRLWREKARFSDEAGLRIPSGP